MLDVKLKVINVEFIIWGHSLFSLLHASQPLSPIYTSSLSLSLFILSIHIKMASPKLSFSLVFFILFAIEISLIASEGEKYGKPSNFGYRKYGFIGKNGLGGYAEKNYNNDYYWGRWSKSDQGSTYSGNGASGGSSNEYDDHTSSCKSPSNGSG